MIQVINRCSDQLSFVQRSHAQVDEFWTALGSDDQLLGQCGVWWRHTPPYQNERVGLIGYYQAADDRVGDLLLNWACERLARQGCTCAIAPMDGNPWQRYRVVTEGTPEPAFFLEPDYPKTVIAQFQSQGFAAIAHYSSAVNTDLSKTDPRSQRIWERLQNVGITIRCLDLSSLEAELQKIYELVCISFRHNFLYTSIPETDFVGQYQTLLPYINPELVFIAEHQQKVVGVLFAIPNWTEMQRGEPLQTIILKTIAVLPERPYAGLGQILFEHCHATALQLRYHRAIYALIHDQNPCLNLVHRYAHTFRRYAVLAKAL